MTKVSTIESASSDIMNGKKPYLIRARITLPYLVNHAKVGETVFYSDLAKEIGISNPRSFNYILGAIGNALKKLDPSIPKIQCIVVNKNSQFPGDGIDGFMDKMNFSKLNKLDKTQELNRALLPVFKYPKWDWVLEQFHLEPIN
ncbi:MAG TPA: hypothetical protein VGK10_07170 [Prolixibacteraceae bacterium]|jgi:hypothetical protein